jgi:hypothetical protein
MLVTDPGDGRPVIVLRPRTEGGLRRVRGRLHAFAARDRFGAPAGAGR